MSSFAQLFENSVSSVDALKEGEIVTGRIVRIGKEAVMVDIGYKSEGVIALDEFRSPTGDVAVNVGDTIDVFIEARENEDGLLTLSKEKADRLKVWDEVSLACERDDIIDGTVSSRVKGGLSVTIKGGVKAFLPGSQVDLRPVRNLEKLIGQTYQFKVIKFNKKRGNIVLSRRALLEQERSTLKAQTLENLQEGQVVTGTIKNLTEYGAFVDLGGIDGLLHVTDMSWGRVAHPSQLFKVGDQVTVKVLKYSPDTERVSLGIKQITEDPWLNVEGVYPIGARVRGRVVSLTDYGAFVEMEEGIEGLIHVSEMAWRKLGHPSEVLEVGQEVECAVLDVDAQAKRISLGLKQLQENPWNRFITQFSPGQIVRGKVRSIMDYGIFVEIVEGVDGMVHKSDLTWSARVPNPAEMYRKGDEVEAIILSINNEEQRVSLGIKQLFEDPWATASQTFPVGTVVDVRVTVVDEEGCYVELERGVDGFVPNSELTESQRGNVKVGDIVRVLVIGVDAGKRELSLSAKGGEGQEPSFPARYDIDNRVRVENPQIPSSSSSYSRPGATLGDVFRSKLSAATAAQSDDEDDE